MATLFKYRQVVLNYLHLNYVWKFFNFTETRNKDLQHQHVLHFILVKQVHLSVCGYQ